MQINQAPKEFSPVTIILETEEELKLLTILIRGIRPSDVANAGLDLVTFDKLHGGLSALSGDKSARTYLGLDGVRPGDMIEVSDHGDVWNTRVFMYTTDNYYVCEASLPTGRQMPIRWVYARKINSLES